MKLKYVETTEIPIECIEYLREVRRQGDRISRGNSKLDYLTCPKDKTPESIGFHYACNNGYIKNDNNTSFITLYLTKKAKKLLAYDWKTSTQRLYDFFAEKNIKYHSHNDLVVTITDIPLTSPENKFDLCHDVKQILGDRFIDFFVVNSENKIYIYVKPLFSNYVD